jgi:hypothetical protein
MHDEAVCQSKLQSELLHYVAMQGDGSWLDPTTVGVQVLVSVGEPGKGQTRERGPI